MKRILFLLMLIASIVCPSFAWAVILKVCNCDFVPPAYLGNTPSIILCCGYANSDGVIENYNRIVRIPQCGYDLSVGNIVARSTVKDIHIYISDGIIQYLPVLYFNLDFPPYANEIVINLYAGDNYFNMPKTEVLLRAGGEILSQEIYN